MSWSRMVRPWLQHYLTAALQHALNMSNSFFFYLPCWQLNIEILHLNWIFSPLVDQGIWDLSPRAFFIDETEFCPPWQFFLSPFPPTYHMLLKFYKPYGAYALEEHRLCVRWATPQTTNNKNGVGKKSTCFQRGSGQTEINVASHTVIRPQAGSYFLECLLFWNVLYLWGEAGGGCSSHFWL